MENLKMQTSFLEAIKHRRSYYAISNGSSVPDREIEDILKTVVTYVPSAFNSQTTRMVLLLGKEHRKLWDIVLDSLRAIVDEERFGTTENKIERCFASGYGTVLFFEDESVVKGLQESFPLYKDNFPIWSQHTSSMHQYVTWVMLEDVGFGASLQHYNPLIDDEVKKTWNLPDEWKLIAQMPFGIPVEEPGEKEFEPIDKRVLFLKS